VLFILVALLVVPLTGWGVLLGGLVVAGLLAWKLATGRVPAGGRQGMIEP
jgi:hypothetical protein